MRLLIALAALLATTGAHAAAQGPPRTVTVPTLAYPTVQAGIDAVAPGGTVRLQPGLYLERVVIEQKTVKLAGIVGHQARAAIQAPDDQASVVTYGPGGGGTLQDLTLLGGYAGVEAPVRLDNLQTPGPVVLLRQVEVRAGLYGLHGAFDTLDIANSKVEGVARHGLVAIQPRVLKVMRSLFRTGGSVGIYIVNTAPPAGDIAWVVTRTTVHGFRDGGLHVVGRGAPVLVSWFTGVDNGTAGITLDGTPSARITSSRVSGTYPDADGNWGDGIRIAGAAVELVDVTIEAPARAGVSIFGCAESGQRADAAFKDVLMNEPGFDINWEVYPGCGSSLAGSVAFTEYMTGPVSTVLCLHAATPGDTGCSAVSGGPSVPVGPPL